MIAQKMYTSIHNSQDVETTQTSITVEWANQMWYMHPCGLFLTVKSN